MNCPVCGIALVMSERKGVEIDYCPQCRGVWLDRGELDKIIERSISEQVTSNEAYEERYDDDDKKRYPEKRKRRSFLDDIFDF